MGKFTKRMKIFAKHNSPTVFSILTGVGVVSTMILSIKETPKALKIIEKEEKAKGKKLTKKEIVKCVAPAYIPATLCCCSTLFCLFMSDKLSRKQRSSLFGAYIMLDKKYKEYKNKVREIYGEEADDFIETDIAKDKYEEQNKKLYNDQTDDNVLFYDCFSKRYFYASPKDILYAECEINKKLAIDTVVNVNDFYELLPNITPLYEYEYYYWCSYDMVYNVGLPWIYVDCEERMITDVNGKETKAYFIDFPTDPLPYGYMDISEKSYLKDMFYDYINDYMNDCYIE